LKTGTLQMLLRGQVGSETLRLRQMTGNCKSPAEVLASSQRPDYFVADSQDGRNWRRAWLQSATMPVFLRVLLTVVLKLRAEKSIKIWDVSSWFKYGRKTGAKATSCYL